MGVPPAVLALAQEGGRTFVPAGEHVGNPPCEVIRMRSVNVVVGIVVVFVLSGQALAGNISVLVLRGGTPEAGTKVYAASVSALTDAAGKCVLAGVPAGTHTVFAEKLIGGVLYGAVRQNLSVPATGSVTVKLNLTRAIRLNEYMLLKPKNYWAYTETVERPTGVTTKGRQEMVVGSATIGGETAMKTRVTWSGTTDTFFEYSNCTTDGYVMYREEHVGGDVVSYVPPLRFPNLVPQGQPLVAVGTAVHSSGATEGVKIVATLEGFETVTVGAGTFAGCARIRVERAVAGASETGTIWFARGVGKVKNVEARPDKKTTQTLEKYQIVR